MAASSLSGLGVLSALIVFTETAKAGSRFETTPLPSTKASTNLDFTIIIPEVMYVGSTWDAGDRDTPKAAATRALEGTKPGETYVVLTNGGTLAFAPEGIAGVQSAELDGAKEAPEGPTERAHLVAMP